MTSARIGVDFGVAFVAVVFGVQGGECIFQEHSDEIQSTPPSRQTQDMLEIIRRLENNLGNRFRSVV